MGCVLSLYMYFGFGTLLGCGSGIDYRLHRGRTPGEHCYQAGDWITALVRCINGHGAFLEHGDLNVLIPDEGKNTHLFQNW